MKSALHASLLVKVLGWLFLHLLILVLAFAAFVAWQLGLGLDSLLSGAAGERLRAFGEVVHEEIIGRPAEEWNQVILPLATARHVTAAIYDPAHPGQFHLTIPANVLRRLERTLPPGPEQGPAAPRRPPQGRFNGPPDGPEPPVGRNPSDERKPPESRGCLLYTSDAADE